MPDCEACGYKVARRTKCKGCGKLTCSHCVEIFHCVGLTCEYCASTDVTMVLKMPVESYQCRGCGLLWSVATAE